MKRVGTHPRLTSVAAGMTVLAGAALLLASMANGWTDAFRQALGYEVADVTWQPDAWAGFFWPALPLAPAAGGLLLVTGLLAFRYRMAALAAVGVGAAASGLLLGLLAGPRWPTMLVTRVAWEASPGPMVWSGLGLALLATAAAWVAWVSGPTYRVQGRLTAGATVGLLPMVALAVVVAITAAVTPAAVGGVPPSRIPPIPDWRTHPEEPYPFVTPVPMQVPTTADGLYTREPTDHWVGTRAQCTRCAPFPRDYGRSTLTLALGRYRLEQVLPRYAVTGHYAVAGNRITFFNDPECGRTYGVYTWRLEGDELGLEVVDDPCAFGQRARDLTDAVWTVAADD